MVELKDQGIFISGKELYFGIAFIIFMFTIAGIILIEDAGNLGFQKGWICKTEHDIIKSLDILGKQYPSNYCEAFAKEWDRLVEERGGYVAPFGY
jgi:hypothetical protein